MFAFLFFLLQLILWIIVGAFFAIVTILPILAILGIWELFSAATINNLLNGIHKIPVIGPVISGTLGMAIGLVLIAVGVAFCIDYAFIFIRCIAGARF